MKPANIIIQGVRATYRFFLIRAYNVVVFFARRKRVDDNAPAVFFCHTPYHVMMSICYSIQQKGRNEIVLYKALKNVNLLAERLEECGLFFRVYIAGYMDSEYSTYEKAYSHSIFGRWGRKARLIESEYDMTMFLKKRVYIFNDSSVVGYYLNCKRIPYILLEDGLNHYAKKSVFENRYRTPYECAYQYFRNTQVQSNGGAPYTREVWVDDASKVRIPFNVKFVDKPKRALIHLLSSEDRKTICYVFNAEESMSQISSFGKREKTLFLTYPLAKDGILKSESEQIDVMRNILKKYTKGELIIKPHPRDTVDYGEFFPNAFVITRNDIPIEVFDYSDIVFDRGITIGSTSLSGLLCVTEKIILSPEDCKNGVV